MKLKIKTVILQEMLTKAIKGNGNNKFLPITSLLELKLKDNVLSLTTTDSVNWLVIKEENIEGDDFNLVIESNTFSKLIDKITSEYIDIAVAETSLKIKGNGEYTIKIPLDESGEFIKFPNEDELFPNTESFTKDMEIKLSDLLKVLKYNSSAVALTFEEPCYMGIYFNDKSVVSTDTFKMCSTDVKIPLNELLSLETVKLFNVLNAEKVRIVGFDNKLAFMTDTEKIITTVMDSKKDYNIDTIKDLIIQDFNSFCEISRSDLLSTLDRIKLFVDELDGNSVYLSFKSDGIEIESKKSDNVEKITYKTNENFEPFECSIDVELLYTQLATFDSITVKLGYGNNSSIKLYEDNVINILALLESK